MQINEVFIADQRISKNFTYCRSFSLRSTGCKEKSSHRERFIKKKKKKKKKKKSLTLEIIISDVFPSLYIISFQKQDDHITRLIKPPKHLSQS